MRLVLDTNVVVSGLIWNGPPRRLLDLAASGDIALFSSTVLLEELAGVLERRKFAASLASRGLTATFLTQRYGAVTTLVFPARADRTVPTDADEDHVIAAAVHANVDGDGNLLKEDDITEKGWLLLNDLYTAQGGAGKNTPPTLLKQLANRRKLTAQLPLRRGRRRNLVLCPKSGDIMRAARTHAGSAVADDTLYWYEASDERGGGLPDDPAEHELPAARLHERQGKRTRLPPSPVAEGANPPLRRNRPAAPRNHGTLHTRREDRDHDRGRGTQESTKSRTTQPVQGCARGTDGRRNRRRDGRLCTATATGPSNRTYTVTKDVTVYTANENGMDGGVSIELWPSTLHGSRQNITQRCGNVGRDVVRTGD